MKAGWRGRTRQPAEAIVTAILTMTDLTALTITFYALGIARCLLGIVRDVRALTNRPREAG